MQEDEHRRAAGPAGAAASSMPCGEHASEGVDIMASLVIGSRQAVAARARHRSTPTVSSAENSAHSRDHRLLGERASPSDVRRRRRPSCAAQCGLRLARLSLSALVSSTSSLTEPLATRGATNSSSLLVELGEAEARIDQQHDAAKAAPHREVLGHHLLPAQLGAARDRGVAVAGQVGEQRVGRDLRAELEQVDVLRAARRLRGEGEALLLRQRIDRGRLAGIGAADEGDLGQLGRRAAGRAGSRS